MSAGNPTSSETSAALDDFSHTYLQPRNGHVCRDVLDELLHYMQQSPLPFVWYDNPALSGPVREYHVPFGYSAYSGVMKVHTAGTRFIAIIDSVNGISLELLKEDDARLFQFKWVYAWTHL